MDNAGNSAPQEVVGMLGWNDLEGGFWSLDLDSPVDGLGDRIVLAAFTPPEGLADGSPMRARVVPQPDFVDFAMSGTRVDVLEASPA